MPSVPQEVLFCFVFADNQKRQNNHLGRDCGHSVNGRRTEEEKALPVQEQATKLVGYNCTSTSTSATGTRRRGQS